MSGKISKKLRKIVRSTFEERHFDTQYKRIKKIYSKLPANSKEDFLTQAIKINYER